MQLEKGFAGVQAFLQTHRVEDLVQLYLERIRAQASLNAFVDVYEQSALTRARALDAQGPEGLPLFGMVLGVKDNIAYQGHPLGASSKILEGFESLYTATCLQRLIDAGALVIGRLNCDEFAMGSGNLTSHFGPVKNPIDPERVPGGSSGGSAAAVAAGLCTVALGTDTGGSIRQPAAFCGVVGMKPSYGRVSRYGLIAYGSSLDQAGPLCQTVEDAALVWKFMAGPDPMDMTSSEQPVLDPASTNAEGPLRIGVLKQVMEMEGMHPEVREAFDAHIQGLQAKGHQIVALDFPYLEALVPTYYVISTAEASSNLSRFDGVHYGYRSPKAKSLEETYTLSRSEGFGAEVKRRIMTGTFVLSVGYYDAYYKKGMQVRRLIQEATDSFFEACDVVLSPTSPNLPFKINETGKDPIQMYLEDLLTVQANLSGNPAMSIPIPVKGTLPVGLQLMAPRMQDHKLFAWAKALS